MKETTYEKLFWQAGEAERDLLARLRVCVNKKQAEVLYEHPEFPPSYDDAGIVAPNYIRYIAIIKEAELYAWFQAAAKRMVELHKQAVILKATTTGEGCYSKPPRRYPVFLQDVFSLKVVEKQAVTSSILKTDDQIALVSLKTKWKELSGSVEKLNMMNDFASKLGKIGIEAEVASGILYASTSDIYREAKAKVIQVRAPTGTHYKAYIKYNDRRASTIACGLILSNKSFYLIEQKQGRRKTKIDDVAEQIDFLIPFALNKSFWIKK